MMFGYLSNHLYLAIFLTLSFFANNPISASASLPLLADSSPHEIRTDSSFTGTDLVVFGIAEDQANIAIIITGPSHKIVVSQKEKIMGTWIKSQSRRIGPMPLLHFVRYMSEIEPEVHKNILGMNKSSLLKPDHPEDQEYIDAFATYQFKNNLYSETTGEINFINNLFHAVFALPANIPAGRYTIEIFSFKDHKLRGAQFSPLIIKRKGLEAALHDMNKDKPLLYSFICLATTYGIGILYWAIFRPQRKVS